MLELTQKLRGVGASPLCALRLALWKVSGKRQPGHCACAKRTDRGVRATCDELAIAAFKQQPKGKRTT